MITNLQIGYNGRLGNQLFQYAILKSISIKTGYQIALPLDLFERSWHGQKCILNNFKLPSCTFINTNFEYLYEELDARYYDTNIYNVPDNTNFNGFFQNPNYYVNIKDKLRDEFEIKDDIKSKIYKILSKYKNTTVSLHIRRGDLSDGTNPIDTDWSNNFSNGSILYNYYNSALSIIPTNSTIFLFTGGSRNEKTNSNDIDWCISNFNDTRIICIDGLNDIETFTLMTMCDYNITSFSSTFSWWASFLNKNENIIAPKIYYPAHPSLIPDLVYPKNWTLL